jgi:chemotaxis protein MotB
MADEGLRPIIVKRIKKGGGAHHGGAWKIAYADFVTAMMAFFLLMWLLGSTTKGDLQGIADYFRTPLKVAMAGGSGAGDSSNLVKGGGKDLTRKDGQVKKADTPSKAQFKKQLLIDITTDGLRIQIVDEQNRPMFALAKAELQPYTKEILHEIAHALNDVPNRISLSGHTDATPYASGERGYSNWELSADRANASRRELIAGGMDEKKMVRVVGLSSAVPLDKENPFNPINRRISIIVMNKKAEESITGEGGIANVSNEASETDVKKELLTTDAAVKK